jgi:hypothetical protein
MATGALLALAGAYQEGIVDAGRQPELLGLLAFLVTFAVVRTVTHGIRSGARWSPGNVEVKGTHVHHLVPGILLLLVVGYVGVMLEPPSPWHEVIAILFGIGASLTLDEFALWLDLRDVYWSREGRRSIDAVIVAAVLGAIGVLGFGVWIDLAEDVELATQLSVAGIGVAGLVLAILCALKGKPVMAVAALLVPAIGLVGVLRLAHPSSLWARRLYSQERRRRAQVRFGGGAPVPAESRGDRSATP